MVEIPKAESQPKIVSADEIRKQKILVRISELQATLDEQEKQIKIHQAAIQETNAKLQQVAANMNFTNGAMTEKKSELAEYEQ